MVQICFIAKLILSSQTDRPSPSSSCLGILLALDSLYRSATKIYVSMPEKLRLSDLSVLLSLLFLPFFTASAMSYPSLNRFIKKY